MFSSVAGLPRSAVLGRGCAEVVDADGGQADAAVADDVAVERDERPRPRRSPSRRHDARPSGRRCRVRARIGTRISVSISASATAVSYGPSWNSRAGTSALAVLRRGSPWWRRAPTSPPTCPRWGRPGTTSRRWCHGCAPTGSAITRSASAKMRVVLVGHGRLQQIAVAGHRPDADLATLDLACSRARDR